LPAANRRRTNPETRRDELVDAARKVFALKGVAGSTVSDIVKAADVAQGTFYLYFKAKGDIVNAVVEQIGDELIDAIERSVRASEGGAVARLRAFSDILVAAVSDPAVKELAELFHLPGNRPAHDRLAERFLPRIAPMVEEIVRQGIAEGSFIADDPRGAAWFVLGGLHALETAFTRDELSTAIGDATTLALRALGCGAPAETPTGSHNVG